MGQFTSPQTGSAYQVVTAEDMLLVVCLRYLGGNQWRIRIQVRDEFAKERLEKTLAQGLEGKGWSIKAPGDHASITVNGYKAACAATGDAVRAVLQVI